MADHFRFAASLALLIVAPTGGLQGGRLVPAARPGPSLFRQNEALRPFPFQDETRRWDSALLQQTSHGQEDTWASPNNSLSMWQRLRRRLAAKSRSYSTFRSKRSAHPKYTKTRTAYLFGQVSRTQWWKSVWKKLVALTLALFLAFSPDPLPARAADYFAPPPHAVPTEKVVPPAQGVVLPTEIEVADKEAAAPLKKQTPAFSGSDASKMAMKRAAKEMAAVPAKTDNGLPNKKKQQAMTLSLVAAATLGLALGTKLSNGSIGGHYTPNDEEGGGDEEDWSDTGLGGFSQYKPPIVPPDDDNGSGYFSGEFGSGVGGVSQYQLPEDPSQYQSDDPTSDDSDPEQTDTSMRANGGADTYIRYKKNESREDDEEGEIDLQEGFNLRRSVGTFSQPADNAGGNSGNFGGAADSYSQYQPSPESIVDEDNVGGNTGAFGGAAGSYSQYRPDAEKMFDEAEDHTGINGDHVNGDAGFGLLGGAAGAFSQHLSEDVKGGSLGGFGLLGGPAGGFSQSKDTLEDQDDDEAVMYRNRGFETGSGLKGYQICYVDDDEIGYDDDDDKEWDEFDSFGSADAPSLESVDTPPLDILVGDDEDGIAGSAFKISPEAILHDVEEIERMERERIEQLKEESSLDEEVTLPGAELFSTNEAPIEAAEEESTDASVERLIDQTIGDDPTTGEAAKGYVESVNPAEASFKSWLDKTKEATSPVAAAQLNELEALEQRLRLAAEELIRGDSQMRLDEDASLADADLSSIYESPIVADDLLVESPSQMNTEDATVHEVPSDQAIEGDDIAQSDDTPLDDQEMAEAAKELEVAESPVFSTQLKELEALEKTLRLVGEETTVGDSAELNVNSEGTHEDLFFLQFKDVSVESVLDQPTNEDLTAPEVPSAQAKEDILDQPTKEDLAATEDILDQQTEEYLGAPEVSATEDILDPPTKEDLAAPEVASAQAIEDVLDQPTEEDIAVTEVSSAQTTEDILDQPTKEHLASPEVSSAQTTEDDNVTTLVLDKDVSLAREQTVEATNEYVESVRSAAADLESLLEKLRKDNKATSRRGSTDIEELEALQEELRLVAEELLGGDTNQINGSSDDIAQVNGYQTLQEEDSAAHEAPHEQYKEDSTADLLVSENDVSFPNEETVEVGKEPLGIHPGLDSYYEHVRDLETSAEDLVVEEQQADKEASRVGPSRPKESEALEQYPWVEALEQDMHSVAEKLMTGDSSQLNRNFDRTQNNERLMDWFEEITESSSEKMAEKDSIKTSGEAVQPKNILFFATIKSGQKVNLSPQPEDIAVFAGVVPDSTDEENPDVLAASGRVPTPPDGIPPCFLDALNSAQAAKSPRAENRPVRLIPINEPAVDLTSGLLGAAVGFSVGGPILSLLGASAANYVSRDEEKGGDMHDITQMISESTIGSINLAGAVLNTFDVDELVFDAVEKDEVVQPLLNSAKGTLKTAGDVLNVVGDLNFLVVRAVVDLNDKVELTSKVSRLVSQWWESVSDDDKESEDTVGSPTSFDF